MAPPLKFTAEQVTEALQASKGLISPAARMLRCRPNTVRSYLQRYPSVKQVVEDEREQMLDVAELALYKAIQSGEAWAVCFTLKTIGRSRGYVERNEHTGRDGGPIEIKTITVALPALGGADDDGDGE